MQKGSGRGESCDTTKEAEEEGTKKQEKAFIIGGGTSAKPILDDSDLRDAMGDYTVIGCNKAVEHIDCDIMVVHDHGNFINGKQRSILDKFDGAGGIYAPASSNRDNIIEGVRYLKRSTKPSFSFNGGVFAGGNCGCLALSLAVTLGFKEIHLVGMDSRFNEAMTSSHFHGGYGREKMTDIGERVYEAFASRFETLGKHLSNNKPDVKVFNLSQISLIDIDEDYFKRISIEDALNG